MEDTRRFGSMIDHESVWNRCNASLYDPMSHPWHTIRDTVMHMEQENFHQAPESEEKLFGLFFHPESTVVILTDPFLGMDQLIGFSIVVPEDVEYELPDSEFKDRLTNASSEVGYIHCTQIIKGRQKRGLGAKINREMLNEISKFYDLIARDALIANGYAQTLLKVYGNQILNHYPHKSQFGPQEYMEIVTGRQLM